MHTTSTTVVKSYDWHTAAGLVMINQSGVRKTAFTLGGSRAAHWTSKYGSVTFNQYGRELPNGGMNTAGLVVEVMWLPETQVPPIDDRPAITELQWIQYQLDNFSSVQEVIRHARALRVEPIYGRVHYLVCDQSGECAAFEYIRGELIITSGEKMLAPALTNSSYRRSAAYLAQHLGYGGRQAPRLGPASLDRFTRAATYKPRAPRQAPVAAGFELLDSVAQGSFTVWQIVYQPTERLVHFRTRDARAIRSLDLKKFSTSCTTPVQIYDINAPHEGHIERRFEPYTPEANRQLIQSSVSRLPNVPSLLSLLATGYASRGICTEPSPPASTNVQGTR